MTKRVQTKRTLLRMMISEYPIVCWTHDILWAASECHCNPCECDLEHRKAWSRPVIKKHWLKSRRVQVML